MIYQALLYSRSLSKDYRWMIVPSKVSLESLKALNQLYNLYDQCKHAFGKSSVLPLYCLNHPEATFLVSCGLSNHKDKDGRNIYCLQGISIPHEYRRHFWFILPWILAHYDGEGLLNTWRKTDFSGADDIVCRTSENYSFKLDPLDESLAELMKTPKSPAGKLFIHEPTYIAFDTVGLKELSHILSSYHDCIDFAFGATREMIKAFDFKVIAKVESRSKAKSSTRATVEIKTVDIPSSSTPEIREEAASGTPNDPLDRFDPRKKSGLNQPKTLGGNGSSRVFNQLLPRFLSLFKIGKKLKRSGSSSQQNHS